MCLESFNQFLDLAFALWGLAVFALILATIATIALLDPLGLTNACRRSVGFTCPCYAPPLVFDVKIKDSHTP